MLSSASALAFFSKMRSAFLSSFFSLAMQILKRENAESLGAWARKSDSPWPCLEELSLGQNHFKGDCSALLCASWPCLISLSMPNNGLQGCFAAQDAKNGKDGYAGARS